MPFTTSKCKGLHFGTNNRQFDYFRGNHTLDVVNEKKELGVCITNNLKAARQFQLAYSKENKVLGLISRTISYKNTDMLLKLYETLVHSQLEYCVSAWSPHYAKDKLLLEHVQHRLTRMIPG